MKDYDCGFVVFFKQKTSYDMRISDWRSDVCCSDLADAAHLGIAVSGHQHFGEGLDVAVATADARATGFEPDPVFVRRAADRLQTRGPGRAVVEVAQVQPAAVIVAGRVRMPAGDRAVAPVAVSGARPGQHDGVASVREQLQPRRLATCKIMHGTWTPDRRPPFMARRW